MITAPIKNLGILLLTVFTTSATTSMVTQTGLRPIGKTRKGSGIQEVESYDEDNLKYKELFLKENKIEGAILVNNSSEKQRILRYIEQNLPVSDIEEDIMGDFIGSTLGMNRISVGNSSLPINNSSEEGFDTQENK